MDIMGNNGIGNASSSNALYTFNVQKHRNLYASPSFKKDKDGNPIYKDGFFQLQGCNPIFMDDKKSKTFVEKDPNNPTKNIVKTHNNAYTMNVRAHKKEFNELTNNLLKDIDTLQARKQKVINERNESLNQNEQDSLQKLRELEKLMKKKNLSAKQKDRRDQLQNEVYQLNEAKKTLSQPAQLSKAEEKELAELGPETADLQEKAKLSSRQLQETTKFQSPTKTSGFVYATLDVTKLSEQIKVQQAADAKAELADKNNSVKTQREAKQLQNKADTMLKEALQEEESPYAFHVLKQVITEQDKDGNTRVKLDENGKPMQRFYLTNMDIED